MDEKKVDKKKKIPCQVCGIKTRKKVCQNCKEWHRRGEDSRIGTKYPSSDPASYLPQYDSNSDGDYGSWLVNNNMD